MFATHRATPHGVALLMLLLLAGCASQQPWPATQSDQVLLSNVPFHPQEQYQCGPAALAMMLNAQGVSVTPAELVSKVYLPERQGSLQLEMVATARQYGVLVYPLEPQLNHLLAELEAGNPVLVLQNLRFDWWPQWHFAVVVGYEASTQALILHSGTEANYRQPLPAFLATWSRSGHWARTMLPPDQLPATAQPLPFLRSGHDLESTGQLDAAREAYLTAQQAWPAQPAAYLGIGNIAYAHGQWAQATEAFQTMTRRFPHLAVGWNNLAETLDQQACGLAAYQARTCAASVQPDRYDAPHKASQPGPDSPHCPAIQCPPL